MTPDERRELARALAAIDLPHPLVDPRRRRRRQFGLLLTTACCIGLAAWIAILILTLPGRYTSSNWRAVWVGLDIAELSASPRPAGPPGGSARSSSCSWS